MSVSIVRIASENRAKIALAFAALLLFLVPTEYKYDKLFRFFSLDLIPPGLTLPKHYDKKIYFYISDFLSLGLFSFLLIRMRDLKRRLFLDRGAFFLWILFSLAFLSIPVSSFAFYAIPYIRLFQLLSPILLYSFLANADVYTNKEAITRLLFGALIAAASLQSMIAITQYFTQISLGLHFLSEMQFSYGNIRCPCFGMSDGSRWMIDRLTDRVAPLPILMRAPGTLPHPNILGGFLMASLIASYAAFIEWKKWRPLFSLLIPVFFFAMAVTYSRAALFAWGLGTVLWYALQFKDKGKRLLFDPLIRKLTYLIIFSFMLSAALLFQQYTERGGVVNYNATAKGADTVRHVYCDVAYKMIARNPALGVGFTQFSIHSPDYLPPEMAKDRNTTTHNIYLFLASETGLFSLSAFLLFIGSLLLASKKAQISSYTASLIAIFVAFLFIGGCDFYLIFAQQGRLLFFSIAGLLAANVEWRKRE